MRFSTGLTLAAALMGVDAYVGHVKRPSGHPGGGYGGGCGAGSSSAAATAAPFPTVIPSASSAAPAPSSVAPTSSAAATTLTTITKEAFTSKTSKATTSQVATTTTTSSAAAATTTGASSSSLTADQQAALDAQNSARSDVGSAALVWDASLAAEAQTWAEHLVSIGSLTHSEISTEGENLYMGYDSTPYASAAGMWIDEKSSYSGEAITSTNYMTFGLYTQIVWSSTTNVGMGAATDSSGATYVVARYSPPGNYIGETAY